MQLGVGLSFPWHTFVIERMILDKMVRLGFLCYNIDTDLPSEHKFLTFGLGASFISFFLKKNDGDTTMPLRGGKICMC
jgi:hypothetical protein